MDLDKRIKNQTIISMFYKIIGMLVSFIFVPILLSFLGKEDYGIWITITSILTWFTFFDFGIGLGLRNKLTHSLSLNNMNLSKIYISSSYFLVSFIFIVFMIILLTISSFLDWNSILNITKYSNSNLINIIHVSIVGFCLLFIFKIVNNLFYAVHKPSVNELISSLTQITILLVLVSLQKSANQYDNLYSIVIVNTIFPIAILIMFTVYFFYIRRNLVFNWNSVDIKKGMSVMKLGSQFVLLQLSAVILSTIIPFMITKYIGSNYTAEYSIAFKYFNLIQVVLMIILNPYWSAVTHNYHQNNYSWIWRSLKKIMFLSFIGVIMIFIAGLVAPKVFEIWVGRQTVSTHVIYWSALFVGSFIITQPVITFINGTGQIKQQMYFSIIIIILLVPVDLLLFNYSNLGIGSFLLPPIIFRITRTLFGYKQLKTILSI